jgi:hypothetical protein
VYNNLIHLNKKKSLWSWWCIKLDAERLCRVPSAAN